MDTTDAGELPKVTMTKKCRSYTARAVDHAVSEMKKGNL